VCECVREEGESVTPDSREIVFECDPKVLQVWECEGEGESVTPDPRTVSM